MAQSSLYIVIEGEAHLTVLSKNMIDTFYKGHKQFGGTDLPLSCGAE